MKVSINHAVLSCEHASNHIPALYRSLFRDQKQLLEGHRGWDIGAYACAARLAKKLDIPLIPGSVSRMLIDLNRSPHHPRVFSEFTRHLSLQDRQALIKVYYLPYHARLRQTITRLIKRHGCVLHLSIHSFTPAWSGVQRHADIGLLYDPQRNLEKRCAGELQKRLRALAPGLTIRRNYPYRGNTDGATTVFRKEFSGRDYAGIEIEINQKYPAAGGRRWQLLQDTLALALTCVGK